MFFVANRKKIFGIVGSFVGVLIVFFVIYAINKQPLSVNPVHQDDSTIVSEFGFELPVPNGWVLDVAVSSYEDSVRKSMWSMDGSAFENARQTGEFNLDEKKIQRTQEDYIAEWTVGKSEVIVLTSDLSTENGKQNIFPRIDPEYSNQIVLDVESIPIIPPSSYLETSKELGTSKNITLNNGTLVHYKYSKSLDRRSVVIPLHTNKISSNGKQVTSIIISTNGSTVDEELFLEFIKTITLTG